MLVSPLQPGSSCRQAGIVVGAGMPGAHSGQLRAGQGRRSCVLGQELSNTQGIRQMRGTHVEAGVNLDAGQDALPLQHIHKLHACTQAQWA